MISPINQAITLHQNGDLVNAQRLYELCLKNDPKNIDLLMLYGMLAAQLDESDLVVSLMKRILKIQPAHERALFNLGIAYRNLGQNDFALRNFDLAINVNSGYVEACLAKAALLSFISRCDESIEIYKALLAKEPNNPDICNLLALTYKKVNSYGDAEILLQKAISLNPHNYEYLYNLGNLYFDGKKYALAIESYERAAQLAPHQSDIFNNLGNAFKGLKINEHAIASYKKSLELNSENVDAYYNLGGLYMESGEYSESIKAFEAAINISPDHNFLLGLYLHVKMRISDWGGYDDLLEKLISKISSGAMVSSPFPLLSLIDSLVLHQKAAKLWSKFNGFNIQKSDRPPTNHHANKKIKVGYFSADFYNHPVTYLAIELFEKHHRDEFEVIGFSFSGNREDEMSQRAKKSFDHFIDVHDKSDLEVAEIAKSLNLDIAVDLGGYTTDSRASVFAFRLAPIQIGYLGYPSMLGGDLTDYIIADKIIIPEQMQEHYSEKVAYIQCYQVNDSTKKISNKKFTRQDFGLPENKFVFCSFNNNYKITPQTFFGWMRILHQVGDSVLWLGGLSKESRKNILSNATSQGINSDRIIFAERMELMEEHLARFSLADLFLDTYPYGAHTTASDALWAGLPVLTLAGESFPSRVAASLLTNLKLPELITFSQDEYEDIAIKLGGDIQALKALREKLDETKKTESLFNSDIFVSNIETLYKDLLFKS